MNDEPVTDPDGDVVDQVRAVGARLGADAPPFDVEAGAARRREKARRLGLLPLQEPEAD